jgi:CBS domain-containing protein
MSDHPGLTGAAVTDVMSHPVFTVRGDVTLVQALGAMVATGRRHLAVVDSEGRCLGVVGDRAVAAAWADDPGVLEHRRTRQLLDDKPSLVGADATVGDVARRMYADAVDAVAVIDRHGCPIGMVTGGDLIRLMAQAIPAPPIARLKEGRPA